MFHNQNKLCYTREMLLKFIKYCKKTYVKVIITEIIWRI